MSKILLDQPHSLNGVLNMAVNPRTYDDLQKSGLEPLSFLQGLTRRPLLIFVPQRGDRCSLYTHSGSFTVRFTENDVVLLTSFRENKLRDNNDCLRLGISVQCAGGFSMSVKIKTAGVYHTYLNGAEVQDQTNSPTAGALWRLLEEQQSLSPAGRSDAPAHGPHEVPPETKEYLDIAETYAAVDDDLDRASAQQNAPLLFFDPQPALGFDRQDRVAYTVRVNELDEAVYGQNKKVQVELENGDMLGATIIDTQKTSEGSSVTLLFEDQISYTALPKAGSLRPTYSDVQYEVRTKVIEDLRRGKTKAAFLEQVLGPFRTAGFENKDMSALDAELRQQRYPPNGSQMEAIHKGINTKDIMLVMGPPGTGKTTVILEWVKYFIKQEGKRVLISSQNNKAVDNVLERLTEERDISAIRAGNEAKVQANMYPYLLENRMKQLQQQMETDSAANRQCIAQAQAEYEAYRRMTDALARSGQAYAAHDNALKKAAAAVAAAPLKRLGVLRERNDRLLDEMTEARSRLQEILYFMGDPEKHRFLRWLLTPLRGMLRKKAEEVLKQYDELYLRYVKTRYERRQCYAQLTGIYTDETILEEASQCALWEKLIQVQTDRLSTPPNDAGIFPGLVWPRYSGNDVNGYVRAVGQQVQERIRRVAMLKDAVEEWSSHISSQSNYALSDLLLESVDLVGGTCIGINSQRKFAGVDFDVTIIDEAGQIQIHNALVPMSRSPKVIMLGDHKQIPPIASEEQIAMTAERGVDPSLWGTSLFERLYNELPPENKIMLDTQYRMPAQLGDLLSEWFYNNSYYSFQGKRNMPGVSPRLFSSPFVVVDTSAEPKRHEYKPEMGAGNRFEADLVARIVHCLTDPRGPDALSSAAFGIISPYGEQVEAMRRAIRKYAKDLTGEQVHEMVASLDSFQGQERKIIVYSCTRSNTLPPSRPRIGFMKELRRLNVALSRPKEQLVFIGDMQFLASCENGSGTGSESEFSAFIRLMLKHAAQSGEIIPVAEMERRMGAYYG